ncbi:MAG: hypothetical protein AB2556_19535 [Candidatus Thiodiazotropha sp.]
MDDLIDEILAEIPDQAPGQFTDLDDQVPHCEAYSGSRSLTTPRVRRRRGGLLFMEDGRRRPT